MLGKKQTSSNADFIRAWQNIESIVSRTELDNLIDRTVEQTLAVVSMYRRPAFGWSGGKDSQALIGIMRRCNIEGCLMGLTDLEYPEFLRWVTDNMPDDLELFNNGWDLQWLAENQHMLFPQHSSIASKWFKNVQHRAQKLYCRAHNTDLLLLGRRRADGNWMGRDGSGFYRNADGNLVFCPIRDWRHEDVLAYCHYYNTPLAPIYGWPNGFVVGTGAWPARQYTGSVAEGWRQTHTIDPGVVHDAAMILPSAREYLRQSALSQQA